jgi:hypothetical protein
MPATVRGPSSLAWPSRCAIQSWRPIGSKIFGGISLGTCSDRSTKIAERPSNFAKLLARAGAILLQSVPATITSDWRGLTRGAKPNRDFCGLELFPVARLD